MESGTPSAEQAPNTSALHPTPSPANAQLSEKTDGYMHGWELGLMLLGLWLGSMVIAIDQTILAVAVPRITTQFDSLSDAGWYASGYLLPMTAFQTLFGKIYKYVNNKHVYLASIIIFEIGSLMDALAPNSPVFILGRCISGLGAAGLMQGALQIIFLGVELEKRAAYLGLVVSAFGLAVCFGPPLGGAFTDGIGWRWCFWINLPVGAAAFCLVLFFSNPAKTRLLDERVSLSLIWREMDPIGAVLILGWVTALLLALQWGGVTYAWNSSIIIGLFVCFGVVFLLFCLLQVKLQDRAMVPPRTFLSRSVLTSTLFLLFQHMTNYVCTYYIPFYFQAVQGVSAVQSGVQYIPIMLPQLIFVALTGAIVSKTGAYWPLTVGGAAIYTVGTGLLLRLGVYTPTVEWAAYLVVAGIGLGTGMQLPFTAIQAMLPEERVPEGNAILSLGSQLGPAISTLAGQTIFINTLFKEVPLHTSAVSAEAVVNAGATNIDSLTSDPGVVLAIKESYTNATTTTLTFGVVTAGIAVFCAAAMEWKNINVIAEERRKVTAEKEAEEKVESAAQTQKSEKTPSISLGKAI